MVSSATALRHPLGEPCEIAKVGWVALTYTQISSNEYIYPVLIVT